MQMGELFELANVGEYGVGVGGCVCPHVRIDLKL